MGERFRSAKQKLTKSDMYFVSITDKNRYFGRITGQSKSGLSFILYFDQLSGVEISANEISYPKLVIGQCDTSIGYTTLETKTLIIGRKKIGGPKPKQFRLGLALSLNNNT